MVQNGFEFVNGKSLNESIELVKKASLPTSLKVEALVKLGLSKKDIWRFFHAPVVMPKTQRLSYTFGVEIECISNWLRLEEEIANNNVPLMANVRFGSYTHSDSTSGYKFVTDGSLRASCLADGRGIECVSPVLSGKKGFDSLKNTCKALSDANAKVNRTCGLHVHIGANGLSGKQYVNVFKNYQKLENIIDCFMANSRRANNARFAASLRGYNFEECYNEIDVRNLLNSRYFKVNPFSFERHHTIEFRQHQGTTNYKKIEMWVKFCAKLVNWSKDNVLTEIISNINDIPFLTKTEKDYFFGRMRELDNE